MIPCVDIIHLLLPRTNNLISLHSLNEVYTKVSLLKKCLYYNTTSWRFKQCVFFISSYVLIIITKISYARQTRMNACFYNINKLKQNHHIRYIYMCITIINPLSCILSWCHLQINVNVKSFGNQQRDGEQILFKTTTMESDYE